MRRQPSPKCAVCGHARTRHTFGNSGDCTVRTPVRWVNHGTWREPVIGTCTCKRYEPKGEQ